MKIIVCMKQVPAGTKVDIDPETGAMKRLSGDTRTNPYDLFALETALQLRELLGGTVTALTMGPPHAEEMMRDAYSMGADDAVILSDRKFAGSDVLATSYVLSQGIKVLGGADLIICGRQTTDGDTDQVGPAIAEHLMLPHAAWVAEIVKADQNSICVRQDLASVSKISEMQYPCLITRPAFGGNIMAQIGIKNSPPQFATVRYRVMDKAKKVPTPTGQIVICPVTDEMASSRIKILSSEVIQKKKTLEEEEILVVAGRGVRNEKDVEMCRTLAEALGGQLAFTRPMVENGFGDTAHQIGLSGRTVRPKLIITCGVSGAIQFISCMTGSECIVAINNDPNAQIFKVAHYCIVDDLYQIVPQLTELVLNNKKEEL